MANEKQDETFRVIDRRLFTAEGELRKEAFEQVHEEQGPAAGSQAASAAAASPAPGRETPPSEAAETPKPSRNFQMLVSLLAQNATLLLGGYTDPRSGQTILDLDGAREIVDMVETLHEKTRGNLAPEDERLLLDVLGSLRLSFVEMSKAAAQAHAEEQRNLTGAPRARSKG